MQVELLSMEHKGKQRIEEKILKHVRTMRFLILVAVNCVLADLKDKSVITRVSGV